MRLGNKETFNEYRTGCPSRSCSASRHNHFQLHLIHTISLSKYRGFGVHVLDEKTGVRGNMFKTRENVASSLSSCSAPSHVPSLGRKNSFKLWVQHLKPSSASLHHVVQRWRILNYTQNSTRVSPLVLLALLQM